MRNFCHLSFMIYLYNPLLQMINLMSRVKNPYSMTGHFMTSLDAQPF
jgi:hypothetical protein